MAQQNRPTSPDHAPDAASQRERAKPENEVGQGRLDTNQATPTDRPDQLEETVRNRQDGSRQLNAHDDPGGTGGSGQPLNQIDLTKPGPETRK